MTAFLTPLGAAELRAIDIPEPWAFGLADRVRFGEIDVLAHVNNTAYLRWFENFRIHYFRAYDVASYDGKPPRIVLKSLALNFLREVRLGDDYIVTGRTAEVRRTSFRMEYGVWVGGQLCTTGEAVIVNLTDDHQKAPLDEALRQRFVDRDGAQRA